MLDKMGVNSKVGQIKIKLRNDYPINEEDIKRMNKKWKNLYYILIDDYMQTVDEGKHRELKEIVKQ